MKRIICILTVIYKDDPSFKDDCTDSSDEEPLVDEDNDVCSICSLNSPPASPSGRAGWRGWRLADMIQRVSAVRISPRPVYALVYHSLRIYVIVDKNDTHQLMGGECLEGERSITAVRRHLKEQAGVETTLTNDYIDIHGRLMYNAEVDSLPSGQGDYKLASFASMDQLAKMKNNSKIVVAALLRFNRDSSDEQPMPQQV